MTVVCTLRAVLFTLLLSSPILSSPAYAQIGAPSIGVSSGPMKLVEDGYAPFVEAYVRLPLWNEWIDAEAYGGYTERDGLIAVACVVGPCPSSEAHYRDVAFGLRFGSRPTPLPVRLFVGGAQHWMRETIEDNPSPFFALEAGLQTRIRLVRSLYATGGGLLLRPLKEQYALNLPVAHAFRLGLHYRLRLQPRR